ncbi:MAG: cystathionine beta-lyase, partial [Tumebacillaceae bacterium]
YNQKLNALNLAHETYFGLTAVETAYTQGEAWLEQLVGYLKGNLEYLTEFAEQHLKGMRVIQPEGTYLVWLDCRELGMNTRQIQDWMFKEAKVALSEGSQFGKIGEGFLRMNIACPRSILEEGLQRLRNALEKVSLSK